jgi:hypothetical protein
MFDFEKVIIENSTSNTFKTALTEYEQVRRYLQNTKCICGKDIREVVEVINKETGVLLTCCNKCCIRHFRIDYLKEFERLNKTRNFVPNKNEIPEDRLNEKYIKYAFAIDVISPWERDFYMSIYNFSYVSEKQLRIMNKIHVKIINELKQF